MQSPVGQLAQESGQHLQQFIGMVVRVLTVVHEHDVAGAYACEPRGDSRCSAAGEPAAASGNGIPERRPGQPQSMALRSHITMRSPCKRASSVMHGRTRPCGGR